MVKMSEKFINTSDKTEETKMKVPTHRPSFWKKLLSMVVILFGTYVGFGVGIGFSLFASSKFEESAWFTMPIATLFFTIPFVKWLNRNEKGAFEIVILGSIFFGAMGILFLRAFIL